MFKKLRNHMMLFNMLTVSLVMIIAFTVIFLVTHSDIERGDERRLQAVSSMVFIPDRMMQSDVADGNWGVTSVPGRFSEDYGASFVLYVKDGQLVNVNSQLDFNDSIYIDAFRKVGSLQSGKITLAEKKWMFTVAPAPLNITKFPSIHVDSQLTRIIFLDITESVRISQTLMLTLTCVGLGVLLALFWFSYRFAIRAVRPIEESYNKQRQFVADASHELRTPLAIIGANIDAIAASGEESVESQKEWLGYIRAELSRTGKLVDDLLYLAKSEELTKEDSLPFDVSIVCETACASMEAVLYDSGVSLSTDIEKDVIAAAEGEKFAQVLRILLDNAGKYTPHGGEISFTLRRVNDWAVVKVTNPGEGIAAADLPRIFDRFYRADASRSTETGGSGLGLSIAKTIVERSGGTIAAESIDGLTTFTVQLKLI